MAEFLAELCPSVRQRAEQVNDETVHVTGEISKQCVQDAAKIFLAAYSKILEERYKREEELLKKQESSTQKTVLDDFGNSQTIQITQKKKNHKN